MKFTILVDPSLVTITTYLICLIKPGRREEFFFKKYSNFTLFTQKLPPRWVRGYAIYNFVFPYPTDATYQIWLRLAKVVLEKKMLTHDERRTTHDDGRQPIVIGHLAEKRTRPKTLDEAVMAAMQEECIRSQKQRKATLEGTSNKCMQ